MAMNSKTFILLQGTSLELVQDMQHSSEYGPPVFNDINVALFLECSKIKCWMCVKEDYIIWLVSLLLLFVERFKKYYDEFQNFE